MEPGGHYCSFDGKRYNYKKNLKVYKESQKMGIREEINKVLDSLPEDSLEAVLEYARFIQEPEEVESSEAEIKAISKGRQEYEKREYVSWQDIENDVV